MYICFYLVIGLSLVVNEGYTFCEVEQRRGHSGLLHDISRLAGACPPNRWSCRGSVRP